MHYQFSHCHNLLEERWFWPTLAFILTHSGFHPGKLWSLPWKSSIFTLWVVSFIFLPSPLRKSLGSILIQRWSHSYYCLCSALAISSTSSPKVRAVREEDEIHARNEPNLPAAHDRSCLLKSPLEPSPI